MKSMYWLLSVCYLGLAGCMAQIDDGQSSSASSAEQVGVYIETPQTTFNVFGGVGLATNPVDFIVHHSEGTLVATIDTTKIPVSVEPLSSTQSRVILQSTTVNTAYEAQHTLTLRLTRSSQTDATVAVLVNSNIIELLYAHTYALPLNVVTGVPVSIINQHNVSGINTQAKMRVDGAVNWRIVDYSPELELDTLTGNGPAEINIALKSDYVQIAPKAHKTVVFEDLTFNTYKTITLEVSAKNNPPIVTQTLQTITLDEHFDFATPITIATIEYPFSDYFTAPENKPTLTYSEQLFFKKVVDNPTQDPKKNTLDVWLNQEALVKNGSFNIYSQHDYHGTIRVDFDYKIPVFGQLLYNEVIANKPATLYATVASNTGADTLTVYVDGAEIEAKKIPRDNIYSIELPPLTAGAHTIQTHLSQAYSPPTLNALAPIKIDQQALNLGGRINKLQWDEPQKNLYALEETQGQLVLLPALNGWLPQTCPLNDAVIDIAKADKNHLALAADAYYSINTNNGECTLEIGSPNFIKVAEDASDSPEDYPYRQFYYVAQIDQKSIFLLRDGPKKELDLSAIYSESINFFATDNYLTTFIGAPINLYSDIRTLFTQEVSGNGQYFTVVTGSSNRQLAVNHNLYARNFNNLPFLPELPITTQGNFNYNGQRFITHNGQLYGQTTEAYELLGKIPEGPSFLAADGLTAYRFNRTAERVWLSLYDLSATTDAEGNWPQIGTIELMQPANAQLDAEQTPVFEVPQNGQMVFIAQGGTVWTVPLP